MSPVTFTPEEVKILAKWSKRLPPKRAVVKRPEYVDCLLQVRKAFMESRNALFICNVIAYDIEVRGKIKRNLKVEIADRLEGNPTFGNYLLSRYVDLYMPSRAGEILRALRIVWIDQLIEEFGGKPSTKLQKVWQWFTMC